MAVSFSVAEISLTGGVSVQPPKNGMTLFLGPNNSGKSLLLRELSSHVTNPQMRSGNPFWVRDARSEAEGTGEEFLAWLAGRGHRSWHPEQGAPVHYRVGSGRSLTPDLMTQWWEHGRWDELQPLLMRAQWTDTRLQVAAQDSLWDLLEPAHSAVQHLFEDRNAERAFSALMRRAFNTPIVVDRYGQSITLRVGDPNVTETVPPAPPEVVEAFRRLPTLEQQGDGFKSFAQLLLNTMVRPAPVTIIDEPEAFLHPPQARLLGQLLAEMEGPSQVFVSTHSADFLAGVLNADNDRELTLVRLDRSTGIPTARILEPSTVRELLRTPLLRYSNIISGLFHDGVVLCESEGDCQFYAAAFDATRDRSAPHENNVYLHTGGKARLADTARRLRACGIPTAVVADLDLLNDHGTVKRAAQALGGDSQPLAADVIALNKHANGQRTLPTVESFRKEVQAVLNGSGSRPLTDHMTEQISKLIKGTTGWGTLKKAGVNALTGDTYAAAKRLLNETAHLGLFLAPCGELESWVRSIPSGNKQTWLSEVFDTGEHQRPSDELKDFCTRIRTFLHQPVQDPAVP
ncbi:ATP-dependent endonuclease [Streptomyces sp. NPDC127112]|uniref:ATP-dependent nuclease n=1 Tax=Streptomyces sp. NPDC127112 TaxID=3345364 RepID=UPI003637DE11